ncbi:ferredoxin [Methanobrevibacter sp. 87.7]|uniref:tungsten-dependent formylmethanofuran dehydrogenase subunit FwdF n=1 Tax=Methanobrevibacter sp. 87.7 TaxID=387957 RepID=UPI000B513624|nr:tungsten-dependent formylmethanofuran dehydrogenase subunit FwdF [Methanobrevibacter sp. 87.7]OWT32712.1 ferredoxin [Methanobrevibacter sp. 87.7]
MSLVKREGIENRELIHNNDKCVGCGICADICPTESLRLGPIVPIARGLLKMDYISCNANNCVLCGLCASACPFDALSLEIDGEVISNIGSYPVWHNGAEINDEDCLYCENCVEACPRDSIFFKRELPDRNDLLVGTISVNEDDCIYCKVCSELCPAEAITISSNNEFGIPDTIEINEDKCVYCQVCKRACPQNAIKAVCSTCMHQEEIEKPKITGTIFIEQNCVNCGWCESVCPADAVKVNKPFVGEVLRDPELVCKGETCHACQDVCPCNAIEIIDNESSIDPSHCVLCGACAKACPQHLLTVKRDSMKLDNIQSPSWKSILGKLVE